MNFSSEDSSEQGVYEAEVYGSLVRGKRDDGE